MIGERGIVWIVARISLYSWGLATIISLGLVAAAGVAAFFLLRRLFGERPAILAPLVIYLITPLTADLGWWTAALESFPLHFGLRCSWPSVLMCSTSELAVLRNLIAALCWTGIGILFFEKGIVVSLLLHALTSGFLAGRGSWVAGARVALARYRVAWILYAALLGAYAVLLVAALKTSTTSPQPPSTLSAVVTFAWPLVSKTLLPGAMGGPWQWRRYLGAGTPWRRSPAGSPGCRRSSSSTWWRQASSGGGSRGVPG